MAGPPCATITKVKGVAAAFMALALAGGLPPVALRTAGLEFLDGRPIVIDLSRSSVGQRWRVSVLDGQPGGAHRLALYVSFQPAGVLAVPVQTVSTKQGDVAAFVVELRRRVAGSGELLLASGGTVVRRPISTASTAGRTAVLPTSLQFSGIRLMPFGDRLRVGSVTVARARPEGELSIVPRHVGILTSSRGESADVVRRGNEFSVFGATRAGQYTGSVDFAPGTPGGEVDTTLRVRDAPVWALLVLLLGLLAVRALNQYQHRDRPRRLLDLRLARLRDRANAAQLDTHMTYRLCAAPGEPGLLLDRQIAAARAAVGEHATPAELAAWEPDGSAYQRLTGLVEAFEGLSHALGSLQADRDRTQRDFQLQDRDRGRTAIAQSPVGEVLRGRRVESAADLTEAARQVDEARTYLRDLGRLYRRVIALRAAASPDIRDEAEQVLTKLFTGSATLAAIDVEVDELVHRWKPDPQPVVVAPPAADRWPSPAPVRPPVARPPAAAGPRRWRRAGVALAIGATLLLLPCAAFFFLADGGLPPDASPTTGVQPTPSPPVTSVPQPTAASALPEAPASTLAVAPPAVGAVRVDPTFTDLVWYTTVLPVLLAAVVALAGWLVWRAWRRGSAGRVPAFDAASIDRVVRSADRRFTLFGGALVVLGGMSVLYAGNATFGSAADYLTMGLWAAGFGEGLALIRRFLPFGASA